MSVFYRKQNADGKVELVSEEYKGCVLTSRERNYHDDSDFYALVWDEASGTIKDIEYATTRFGGTDYNSAVPDITPENLAKANAYAYKMLRKRVWASYISDLRKPIKGDMVQVVHGRKVPCGTIGRLFWIGQEQVYGGYSRWSQKRTTKVGIALTERKEAGRYVDVVWTYLENLEAAPETLRAAFKLSHIKRQLKSLKRPDGKAWWALHCYYSTIPVL